MLLLLRQNPALTFISRARSSGGGWSIRNVITRLTRDTKMIASRNTDSRPRACIYYHKAMAKQLRIKDSLTTTDCAVAQTLVDGKNTILASCYMDRNDTLVRLKCSGTS